MELWTILALYGAGLGLLVAEAVIPGVTMGVVGLGLLGVSTVLGFRHHWAVGLGQVGTAVVVAPLCFWAAVRRLRLKATIEGDSFARSYDELLGKEGRAQTDLRPAGIVLVDGKKVDVVTGGERIEKGARVEVVRVEGNRIVVRQI